MFSTLKKMLPTSDGASSSSRPNRQSRNSGRKSNTSTTPLERLDKLAKCVAIGAFVALASLGFGIVSTVNAQAQVSSVTGNLKHVVVSMQAIPAGTTISTSNIQVVDVPASYIVDGAFDSLDSILGKSTCINIPANAQITKSELIDAENDSTLSAKIHPNMQAITIAVSSDTGISSLLRCGDLVNVNLTDGDGGVVGCIPSVRVLGLDGSLSNSNTASSYSTVTLQVDASQADQIISTEQYGKIVLTMVPLSSN